MYKEYKDLECYSDVLAYLKNDLSENERKQFEAIVNEDSFLKEAVDGLSLLSADALEHDFKSLRTKKTASGSGVKAAVIISVFVAVVTFAVYWWFLKPESKNESFDNGSLSSYSDEPILDDENPESVADTSLLFFMDNDTIDVMGLSKSDDSISSLMNNASEKPERQGSVQSKPVEKQSVERNERPTRPKPRRVTEEKTQVEKIDTPKNSYADSIYPLMNEIDVIVGHSISTPDTMNFIANPTDSFPGRDE
ncbi:MAG: hypothetical protein JXR50_02870 [Prolixibacteraceae bacterium]|nr:hypothetical protein [Prolixibacteraceae bacterium]MBN2648663.1 hypothetical protein [Prolixibacteraceae bacterium]